MNVWDCGNNIKSNFPLDRVEPRPYSNELTLKLIFLREIALTVILMKIICYVSAENYFLTFESIFVSQSFPFQ